MNDFLSTFLVFSQWQTLAIFASVFVFFYALKKLQDREIDFSIRMLVGLFGGLGFGFLLQHLAGYPDKEMSKEIAWLVEARTWFGFFASVFISFIKMLVIPIICVSIVKVVLDIDKDIKISALLSKTMFWILLTTGIAATTGVLLGYGFNLGGDMAAVAGDRMIREVKNITQILLGLVPSNIVDSMVKNNIISLVIFCFLLGFGAKGVGKLESAKESYIVFEKFINALHQIVMSITLFIIRFMPYAVVCMMAEVLLSNGFGAIKTAAHFIILTYVAMFIMFAVHLMLVASRGLNPLTFTKKAFSVWLFAFSSRSSVGTLPLTVSTLQNKIGVSPGVANFVASLGTTVGLNGCAGYFPAMAAIFIATSIGVEIDFSFMVIVVLMAMLGSLGIAGVPGSATMAASVMLTGIGFGDHFALLSIVLAIDPIIDMARTASNVSGAMTASICTDRGLKTLDVKAYNS